MVAHNIQMPIMVKISLFIYYKKKSYNLPLSPNEKKTNYGKKYIQNRVQAINNIVLGSVYMETSCVAWLQLKDCLKSGTQG